MSKIQRVNNLQGQVGVIVGARGENHVVGQLDSAE